MLQENELLAEVMIGMGAFDKPGSSKNRPLIAGIKPPEEAELSVNRSEALWKRIRQEAIKDVPVRPK